jgi:restriction system protein
MTTVSSMPTWEEFMVPVLQVLSDARQRSLRESISDVADQVLLSDEQRAETLSSGGERANNRIGWALSYLTKAQAVSRPRRGQYVITDFGRALLAQHPNGLTEKHLKEIPAYRDHVPAERTTAATSLAPGGVDTELDPIEQIEQGFARLQADVAIQLLKRLREQDPAFLEQSVLDVLVAMGYGGTDKQARRIGGTGDGGVDGMIDQDKLGLQRIYVQAKRYAADNTVGRVRRSQAFVGALHGRNVSQGIFITTSRFSPGAIEYANSIGSRIGDTPRAPCAAPSLPGVPSSDHIRGVPAGDRG